MKYNHLMKLFKLCHPLECIFVASVRFIASRYPQFRKSLWIKAFDKCLNLKVNIILESCKIEDDNSRHSALASSIYIWVIVLNMWPLAEKITYCAFEMSHLSQVQLKEVEGCGVCLLIRNSEDQCPIFFLSKSQFFWPYRAI